MIFKHTNRPGFWFGNIAEELKAKAIELDIEGPYTFWWHMFSWNTFGNSANGARRCYLAVLRHAE